jgi:hypothetical protein
MLSLGGIFRIDKLQRHEGQSDMNFDPLFDIVEEDVG